MIELLDIFSNKILFLIYLWRMSFIGIVTVILRLAVLFKLKCSNFFYLQNTIILERFSDNVFYSQFILLKAHTWSLGWRWLSVIPSSSIRILLWSSITLRARSITFLSWLFVRVLGQLVRQQLTEHSCSFSSSSWQLSNVTVNIEAIVSGIVSIGNLLRQQFSIKRKLNLAETFKNRMWRQNTSLTKAYLMVVQILNLHLQFHDIYSIGIRYLSYPNMYLF